MEEVNSDWALPRGVGNFKKVDEAGDIVLAVDADEYTKLGVLHGVLYGSSSSAAVSDGRIV